MRAIGNSVGIIPARAGFTEIVVVLGEVGPDHPRSRGVYPVDLAKCGVYKGSSPLARGLLGQIDGRVGLDGIIPARAGFTSPPPSTSPSGQDHPRSRGVYQCLSPVVLEAAGSSPLARGLRRSRHRTLLTQGIIPARAGFTCRSGWATGSATDHPRSRGVYAMDSLGGDQEAGIIPARAGFTPGGHRRQVARWDHPRSRGVYIPGLDVGYPDEGSSPLARGLHGPDHQRRRMVRIIPARAGFTSQPGTG